MAKVYTDKTTGDRVTILKEDEIYYTLDDGSGNAVKVKKETFSKRYEMSNTIDPEQFLNTTSTIENLAKQLQQIDTNKIQEGGDDKTRIKIKPPVVLADSQQEHISPTHDNTTEGPKISDVQRQKMIEEFQKKQGELPQKPITYIDDDDNVIEYELGKPGEETVNTAIPVSNPTVKNEPVQRIDPLQMMFKMFKNNYDVTINLKIEDKIANPQFIAMVMENVEGDAIEYYAKIILEKLLKEPLKLKKEIYEQLKREVYGESVESETPSETSEQEKIDDKK